MTATFEKIDKVLTHTHHFSSEGLRYATEKFPKELQTELKQYRQEQLKRG